MCYSLACLLLATALGGALPFEGHVHSHLLVPAGQQFRLGGGAPQAFIVAAQNVGPVAVVLFEQSAAQVVSARGQLLPGQRARLRVAVGATLLVRNRSPRQAVLEVAIYNGVGLGMTHDTAPAAAN